MKLCYKIFLLLFCTFAVIAFPQLYQPEVGIPHSSGQYPDTSIRRPDYRNRINLPKYDQSLMPLKNVRTGTGVWTELNPKVPRVDYLGIHFINKDTGWACGANGALIKTTDGGKKWKWIELTTTVVLKTVGSFDGQTVIAAGDNGTVILSTDLGETWQTLNLNTTNSFWNIQFINVNLAWLVGENGGCYKTTDRGFTWQGVTTPLGSLPHWDVSFLNVNYGFICSDGGKVIRTKDGGNSWQLFQAGDNNALYTIAIADSLNITTGGVMVKFVHSSDGGNTWIQGLLQQDHPINKIAFTNDSIGYATGLMSSRYRSTDKGKNWTYIFPIQPIGEWNLSFTHGGFGFSAGNELTITKTTNFGFYWTHSIMNNNWKDVWSLNEYTAFVVDKTILKTSNNGENWISLFNPDTVALLTGLSSFFLLDSNSMIVSDYSRARIFKTINGGLNWLQTQVTGATTDIFGINDFFFLDSINGWASKGGNEYGGTILRTMDSGNSWFTLTNSMGGSAIQFFDTLNGYTISRNLFQTIDGGHSWGTIITPDIYGTDLYFQNPTTGWCILGGKLFYTSNAGLNWNNIQNVDSYIYKFNWLNNQRAFITGTKSYYTNDSGITWIDISTEIGFSLLKMHSGNEYSGYAIGNLGLIVRFFDPSFIPVELISFKAEVFQTDVNINWITGSEINNSGFYIERKKENSSFEKLDFVIGQGTTSKINTYSYIDKNLLSGRYKYRLKQRDFNGSEHLSNQIEVFINVDENIFELYSNYPNPFNNITQIEFVAGKTDKLNLEVYNSIGENIKLLFSENVEIGKHYKIIYDASELPSGVYYYCLSQGSRKKIKKMVVLK